jgi:hypothetical protein
MSSSNRSQHLSSDSTDRYLLKPLFKPYFSLLHIILNVWTKGNWQDRTALRQGYLDHYSYVRSIVPNDRLLEFESRDGWEPLCEFHGKDVPEQPYPRINDGDSVVKLHEKLYWWRVGTVVVKAGRLFGAVAVPVLA